MLHICQPESTRNHLTNQSPPKKKEEETIGSQNKSNKHRMNIMAAKLLI